MTIAFLILAAALVLLATVIGVIALAVRSRVVPGPSLVAKTVVVQTKRPDDQSVRGVVLAVHADRWTLTEAFYVTGGPGEHVIPGILHIPSDSIAFVQELSR